MEYDTPWSLPNEQNGIAVIMQNTYNYCNAEFWYFIPDF